MRATAVAVLVVLTLVLLQTPPKMIVLGTNMVFDATFGNPAFFLSTHYGAVLGTDGVMRFLGGRIVGLNATCIFYVADSLHAYFPEADRDLPISDARPQVYTKIGGLEIVGEMAKEGLVVHYSGRAYTVGGSWRIGFYPDGILLINETTYMLFGREAIMGHHNYSVYYPVPGPVPAVGGLRFSGRQFSGFLLFPGNGTELAPVLGAYRATFYVDGSLAALVERTDYWNKVGEIDVYVNGETRKVLKNDPENYFSPQACAYYGGRLFLVGDMAGRTVMLSTGWD